MKKLILLFLFSFSSVVAQAQISGKVVDAGTSGPLPGATVVVE